MSHHRSNRGWNEENERIAKAISNKHAALVWICNHTAKRVERRQRVIDVIIAAGLYLFGTSGLPAAITDSSENENSKIALIVISILAIAFGLFKTIIVAMQENKKIGKNRWALGIHAELTKDIRKELTKRRHKRQKWRKFYKALEDKDVELQKDGPTPPRAILKAYYDQFGNDAVRERILFGGLSDIENTQRITVKKQPTRKRIGETAKQNRQRKQIMRDIIAQSSEESTESDTSSVTDLAVAAPEVDKPKSKSSSKNGSDWKDSGSHGSHSSRKSQESKSEYESSLYSNDKSIEELSESPKNKRSPDKRAGRRVGRRSEEFPESKRPMSTTVEKRRLAAVAARHDMRERYELERYFVE